MDTRALFNRPCRWDNATAKPHVQFVRVLICSVFNAFMEAVMAKYKLVNTLNIGDVLVQTLIWTVLIVVTFGLALPFFSYYFIRLMINKTEIHEIP